MSAITVEPREGERVIVVSRDLFDVFGSRADNGFALSYDWGEQNPDGTWSPTITMTDDRMRLVSRADAELLETLLGVLEGRARVSPR